MNATAQHPHILIVDDNEDATEVLALLIETDGFTAATACSLAEARAEVTRQRPALILLDLNLPDGSGMRLLAQLKADPATAAIHVVILSGMMEDHFKREAQALGALSFLVKPIGHEELTRVLDLAR